MLQNGDRFPALSFARAGGGEIHLPDDLAGGFSLILFHRGSWCPYCNAQLAAFARAADEFAGEGIKVVSVSVDDREKSEALVEKHKLVSRSPTAPMHERFPQPLAPSSMPIPSVSGQPASSLTPKAGS
jgi:peroxiredoxin